MSILVLNGPSSSGKSTLGKALQTEMPVPFLRFSADLILFGGVLPTQSNAAWPEMRPRVFDGYFRSIAALSDAGNHVIAEIVLESAEQLGHLEAALRDRDVLWVGLHCPLGVLAARERARRDRRIGDAADDFEGVHTFRRYDVEVDSTQSAKANAQAIARAWVARRYVDRHAAS